MASTRDIKRRIKSVQSTQQITKAMNLVATSKLQKAKYRLESIKPFYTETKNIISNIVKGSNGSMHPLFKKSQQKSKLIIVVTSDRSFCGGYNTNICKLVYEFALKNKDTKIIAVGGKANEFFTRRNLDVIKTYFEVSEFPVFEDANLIEKFVLDLFLKGEVDEVFIAYTEFVTIIAHNPILKKIIPFLPEDFEDKSNFQMMYEPNEEAVLDYVLPKFLDTIIFGALLEGAVCEQGARMTSMDSATENALEMLDSLTLVFNRARQGAITQEITEIVSGASSLK